MRTPAPLLIVTIPAGFLLRRRQVRKAADRAVSRQSKAMTAELDRRGLTATPAEPAADAAAPEAPTGRWVYRHRHTLAPIAAAAALIALRAAWTIWALGTLAIPAAAVSLAGVWWVRQVSDAPAARRRRQAAIATTAVAVLWVVSPARVALPVWPGEVFFWPVGAALGWAAGEAPAPWSIVLTVLASRWLWIGLWTAAAVEVRRRRFRIRYVPPPVAEVFDETPPGVWSRTLADPDHPAGKLVGSALLDFERLNAKSWATTVACVPGKHGTDDVDGAKKSIAGVYGIKPEWIEVQPQDDYSRPRMIVTEQATLAGYRPFVPGGVDLARGTVEMATYPDGSRGSVQAYRPGQGVKHFWFVGGTGTGKTGALSCYLGRMMQTGIMVLDLADLGETSLPAWAGVAFRAGTSVNDGLMTLRRANAVMDARQAWMKTAAWTDRDGVQHVGISTLDLSADWPIYTACLEEFPEMLGEPEAVELADRIGRLGRKFGVQIIVVTQPADLKGAFGNADALRINIQRGGNVVALANDGGAGTMVFGGAIKVNLGAIPLGQPGMGYVIGPANYRAAMGRMDYIEDKDSIRPPDVMSSFQIARLAWPATPHPVDLAAIERVEAEEAARVEEAAKKAAAKTEVEVKGVTRETVERALRDAVAAAGGAVRLSTVASRLAPEGLDDLGRQRHTDVVRKVLVALVVDGVAVKPKRPDGTDQSGLYGVAA